MEVQNGRQVLSNLPLQMCLHFHLYLVPFILSGQIACFVLKYNYLHPIYQVVLTACHIVSVMVEIIRPFLGYYGNLGEKIPALSGLWSVSLILQIPITIFLCFNEEIHPLPLERFLFIIHLILLIIEVCISGYLIRQLANQQMVRFKERLDEDIPNVKKTK